MKGRIRGKKRKMRNKSVPIDHPGRGLYIVESMEAGLCPDCQTKLVESDDFDLNSFKAEGAKVFECPKCHWQGVLGGGQ